MFHHSQNTNKETLINAYAQIMTPLDKANEKFYELLGQTL